ncbi:MAG TPA: ABC transporter substrate-binding protein [Acidimicrobiales bacterium]|nr:ABC transporter substrate-binding protein [Acidimicrobiales bacterium]
MWIGWLAVALATVSGCGLRVASGQVRSATLQAEGNGSSGQLTGGTASGGGTASASTGGSGATAGGVGNSGAVASGAGPASSSGTNPLAGGSPSSGASLTASASPAPAGGNGGATAPGVTATTITVGNISDLGGPVPGLFQGGPYGTEAYFDYINSLGGVYGRQLKLISSDDQLECNQNEADYQNLVNSVFAFVGSWSLDDNCGAQVMSAHPSVPLVQEQLTPQAAALPSAYSEAPFGRGAALGPFEYYKSVAPGAITAVGTLVGNQPSAVQAWHYSEAAMDSLGYKVIYEDDFNPAQSNFTADVVRMRSQGVKMVYLIALNAPDAAIFASEAAQQGFHPQLWACAVCYFGGYVSESGGAANVEGQYLNVGSALFLGDPSVPEVPLYLKWLAQAAPGFSPDQFSAYSWADAALFVHALTQAGPHLTQKGVDAALAATDQFSDNGLMAPADIGAKKPSNCYLMLQIRSGNYVKVGDPSSGFLCNAPYYSAG